MHFKVAVRDLKAMKTSFEDQQPFHKVRVCLLSEFILEVADVSKHFQAFLENYGKEKNLLSFFLFL